MIFVDTCVLSLALRKKVLSPEEERYTHFLRQMIADDWPLGIPGIVFQETLTGIKFEKDFYRVSDFLDAFPLVYAEKKDHLLAAEVRNKCLSKGIAASSTDSLIAAITINRSGRLYTFDKDFCLLSKYSPLALYELPSP